MIYGKLTDAPRYCGLFARLDRALRCLTPAFLATLGPEPTQLEGEALYATRFTYETVPAEEAFFESHRQYLDIHVMLSGAERVGIASPETLAQYEQRGDLWLYHGAAEQTLTLAPGQFLVVFPGDAHALKIETGSPETVSKAVFKVRLPDMET